MNDKDQLRQSRQSGEKVWLALREQFAEGSGFLSAMLASFRLFLRKQLLRFLLFGLLGAIVGAAVWFIKPKVYEAEMTVSYNHYEKKIYADMLEKLDKLVGSKSYSTLSGLLGLPEETVRDLKGVKGINIRNEDLTEDLSTEKVPFYIVVRVADPSILPALQTALVNYLDGTDFIQNRLKYMKEKSERELVFLENRLAMVDSLSRLFVLKEDNLLNEKSVTRMELLQEALAVYSKIQEVRGSLVFNLNIEVLDGFIANEKPAGKPALVWAFYGFLLGMLLWLIVLLFAE